MVAVVPVIYLDSHRQLQPILLSSVHAIMTAEKHMLERQFCSGDGTTVN